MALTTRAALVAVSAALAAANVEAVRTGKSVAELSAQGASQEAVPQCPCEGFAMESQLARIIAMAYDPDGPRAKMQAAEEVFSCYAWKDLPYDVAGDSILSKVAKKAYSWSRPRAVFGRCSRRAETCVVSFSGAADLGMVAGIAEEGPVRLARSSRGAVFESDSPDAYRFHKFYWRVYSDMRDQVGAQLDSMLDGCKEIVVTGHSIGAAMASLWQWERSEMPIQQITIGQNPAWFGTPPDVACRGKRIVSEEDPVPFLRQFKDKDGNVIRHPLLPMQLLKKGGSGGWTAEALSACDTNQPVDEECVDRCSSWGLHYNLRVSRGLGSHQALSYVADLDAAFGRSN